jgi:hypothetical protein
MDWQYGEVLANRIVSSLFAPVETSGPNVQIYPSASGRIVLCTLRLLEALERDALAEKLRSNMVAHFDRTLPEILRRHAFNSSRSKIAIN